MCPVITILGKAIPMYGVCIVLGAVIAGGIAVLFLQKPYRACHEGYDVAAAATFAMVGVFVGGKALYLLVELPFIVKNWHEILQLPGGAWNLLSGGYVFYGGLLGALFMLWLYSRIAGVRFRPLLLNLTPVIPIAHGFGRLSTTGRGPLCLPTRPGALPRGWNCSPCSCWRWRSIFVWRRDSCAFTAKSRGRFQSSAGIFSVMHLCGLGWNFSAETRNVDFFWGFLSPSGLVFA